MGPTNPDIVSHRGEDTRSNGLPPLNIANTRPVIASGLIFVAFATNNTVKDGSHAIITAMSGVFLFTAQRSYRIYARCASRRDQTRQSCHTHQNERYNGGS